MPVFTPKGGSVANAGWLTWIGKPHDPVAQVTAYVQLYELEIPTDPPTRYRLARWPEDIEFGVDENNDALTYYSYSIGHKEHIEQLGGGLHTVELKISNIDNDFKANAALYNGFVGQPVRYMIVNSANLVTNVPARQQDYEVLDAELTDRALLLKLGQHTLTNIPFPANRLIDQCRFPYKGTRCGYTGGLTSCDKTLEGSNGCEAHSNDDRFGGFRAIPRNPIG